MDEKSDRLLTRLQRLNVEADNLATAHLTDTLGKPPVPWNVGEEWAVMHNANIAAAHLTHDIPTLFYEPQIQLSLIHI